MARKKAKGRRDAAKKTAGNKPRMAEAESESRGSRRPCPSSMEYFCEYKCSQNEWWLHRVNTASDYYCPDRPSRAACYSGYLICRYPSPITDSPETTTEPPAAVGFCEYEYRRSTGSFYLRRAQCEEGHYCPGDLQAFAESHFKQGLQIQTMLLILKQLKVESAVIRLPTRSIEQCQQLSHDPGHTRGLPDLLAGPDASPADPACD